jgi:DME family drug/metabolite transporter
MAVFQGSFFVAATDLGAGPATMISVAAAPAASLLGARRRRQASSPTRPVFGLALATAVVSLLVVSVGVPGLCGAGWAIASGAAYAGFAGAVASCDTHPQDGLAAVVIALLGGALVVTPVAAPQIAQLCSLRNVLLGAYLGLVATALAYAWFAAALAILGRTVVLATLVGQPVAATLLACQLLGWPVGWRTVVALAIAGLSSAWLAISGRPRPDPHLF